MNMKYARQKAGIILRSLDSSNISKPFVHLPFVKSRTCMPSSVANRAIQKSKAGSSTPNCYCHTYRGTSQTRLHVTCKERQPWLWTTARRILTAPLFRPVSGELKLQRRTTCRVKTTMITAQGGVVVFPAIFHSLAEREREMKAPTCWMFHSHSAMQGRCGVETRNTWAQFV